MAANKLSKAARDLAVQRVIAGDTNAEIRARLHDAGYPSDLTDQALSHYRDSQAVKDALERKTSEAMQSGYAQRGERVQKLAAAAKRLEKLIEAEDHKPGTLAMLNKEYRETLRALGDLVDPLRVQAVALDATIETVDRAANDADTKFAALVARSAAAAVLAEPDEAGAGGS